MTRGGTAGAGRAPARRSAKPPPGRAVAPPAGTVAYRMSRTDFEVRCDEDFWKRGDYDARRGLAEVVESPLLGHEWRGGEATLFVGFVCGAEVAPTGALRIEWRGSILEPDASFYFAPLSDLGYADDENCRPELGHRPPALAVEINRSSSPARAAEKRGDYFDMGVREVWTWRPKEGATIYRRSADGSPSSVPESAVVPGVRREDLEELWSDPRSEAPARRAVIVRRVRGRRGEGGAAPAAKS